MNHKLKKTLGVILITLGMIGLILPIMQGFLLIIPGILLIRGENPENRKQEQEKLRKQLFARTKIR